MIPEVSLVNSQTHLWRQPIFFPRSLRTDSIVLERQMMVHRHFKGLATY